jgi:hypothetical protein
MAAIIGFFLIDPLMASLSEALATQNVPQNVATEIVECAKAAGPATIDRVMAEPFWALQSVISVWSGSLSAEAILADVAPACADSLDATRHFFESPRL